MLPLEAWAATDNDETGTSSSLKAEKKLIRRGVGWNAVGLALSKGMSILTKLVLARFLSPEHFGFISMIAVFNSVAKVFADLGFRLSLIHRQRDNCTRQLYDSAYWLLLAAALAVILTMWLGGVPLLIWFYDEPRLSNVALAMSAMVLFQNMQVIPEARLARVMRFRQIAFADMFGSLVGSIAAIGLALAGAGVWSLVAQFLVSAALTSGALFKFSGWRPRLRLDWSLLRSLSSYSKFVVGSRTLISLQQNMDYLLIGKLLGARSLGIYAIAFLLTETLRSQLYWLVSKAVFPFYGRASGRTSDIRSVYSGTVRYMAVTVFPIATLLFLFAAPIVATVVTAKWHAAIIPIRILALASLVVASGGTPSEVLRGVGRPDVDFRVNLGTALFVALPALWCGIQWFGLTGAALAVLFYSCASRVAYGVTLRSIIGITMTATIRSSRQPLLGCAAMIAIKLVCRSFHWPVVMTFAALAYGLIVLPVIIPLLKDLRRLRQRRSNS
jgi:O-antigen/teichoic acid export membrane protein